MNMKKKVWSLPVPFHHVLIVTTLLVFVTVLREYVSFSYQNEGKAFNWFFHFMTSSLNYFTWVLYSPLVYAVARGFQGRIPRATPRSISKHILIAASITFAHCTSAGVFGFLIFSAKEVRWVFEYVDFLIAYVQVGLFSGFITYWVLLTIFVAVDYHRRYKQKQIELANLKSELADARLNALRMQLHPHFLFNALNSVSSLMDHDTAGARRMLNQIAYLLRKMLDQQQDQLIPLRDELQYIRSYLDIQQTRYQDWLTVRYDLSEDTLNAQVPCLILQPLVENAVKHGLSGRIDPGTIRLCSRKINGSLELTVEDDGCGHRNAGSLHSAGGNGIKIVRGRLETLYQKNFQLRFESGVQKGFVARITVPFQVSESGTRN